MGFKSRKSKSVMLLIRVNWYGPPKWSLYGLFDSDDAACEEWNKSIRGRGVTAWSWWGPSTEGEKMLFDPSYTPSYIPKVNH